MLWWSRVQLATESSCYPPEKITKKVDFYLDNFCVHLEKTLLVYIKAHLRSDRSGAPRTQNSGEASKAFQSMVSLYAVTQPVGKVGCILES